MFQVFKTPSGDVEGVEDTWAGELVLTGRSTWYAEVAGIKYKLQGQPRSQRMIYRYVWKWMIICTIGFIRIIII